MLYRGFNYVSLFTCAPAIMQYYLPSMSPPGHDHKSIIFLLVPLKSFDILALYKFDYYYCYCYFFYFFKVNFLNTLGSKDPEG